MAGPAYQTEEELAAEYGPEAAAVIHSVLYPGGQDDIVGQALLGGDVSTVPDAGSIDVPGLGPLDRIPKGRREARGDVMLQRDAIERMAQEIDSSGGAFRGVDQARRAREQAEALRATMPAIPQQAWHIDESGQAVSGPDPRIPQAPAEPVAVEPSATHDGIPAGVVPPGGVAPLPGGAGGGGGTSGDRTGYSGTGTVGSGMDLEIRRRQTSDDAAGSAIEFERAGLEDAALAASKSRAQEEEMRWWNAANEVESKIATDAYARARESQLRQEHAEWMETANRDLDERIANFPKKIEQPEWGVGAGIAVALEGLGAAVAGRPNTNQVMAMLERRIERSIDVQKSDREAERQAIGLASGQIGRRDSMFDTDLGRRAAARAENWAALGQQLKANEFRSKSSEAMANHEALAVAVEQKKLANKSVALEDSSNRFFKGAAVRADLAKFSASYAQNERAMGMGGGRLDQKPWGADITNKIQPYISLRMGQRELQARWGQLNALAIAGQHIPGEEAQAFKNDLALFRDQYIQMLTGAAMPLTEAKRLTQPLVNVGDFKATGESKFGALDRGFTRTLKSYAVTLGLGGNHVAPFVDWLNATAPAAPLTPTKR